MNLATPIPLERLCELAQVSRAASIAGARHAGRGRGPGPARRDPADRVGVAQLWLAPDHRGVEAARLGGEPQAVRRIMREDNLLCLRRRKFVVTTDSNHGRPVYPNLARRDGADRHGSALGGRHHLHSAGDGVRLSGGGAGRLFARVIGWALDRTLEDELTLTALRMALRRRDSPRPDWCIIPTAAVQYASGDYTDLLKDHGIQISMSRKAEPLRQWRLRIVHEDAEVRGGAIAGISRSGRGAGLASAVPREGLQPEAPALGAGLSVRRRSSRPN